MLVLDDNTAPHAIILIKHNDEEGLGLCFGFSAGRFNNRLGFCLAIVYALTLHTVLVLGFYCSDGIVRLTCREQGNAQAQNKAADKYLAG